MSLGLDQIQNSLEYNLMIMNWKVFKKYLDTSHRDNLHSFESSEEVLHAYDDFYRKVDEPLHAADPRLGGAIHRRRSYPISPPWWNEE